MELFQRLARAPEDTLDAFIRDGQVGKVRARSYRSAVGLVPGRKLGCMRHVACEHLPDDQAEGEDVGAVAEA